MAELLLILVLALNFYFLLYLPRKKQWNHSHPDTLASYLKKFPLADTRNGPICGHCGHDKLVNVGFDGLTDTRRLINCAACKEPLYHRALN